MNVRTSGKGREEMGMREEGRSYRGRLKKGEEAWWDGEGGRRIW